MAITDWPADERPREKLLQRGPAALSDAELLAIFLRTGIVGKTAVDLARELFAAFVEDLPAQFEEMRRLQQQQQWEELLETAHRLHGSAAYCGVPALKDAIRKLEAATKGIGTDPAEIADLMDAVSAQIDRLNDLEQGAAPAP